MAFPVILALGGAIFGVLLSVVAIFLILLVLVQRGRGGGLAGALGGMGGSSAFGAKAGDVFTRITIVAAAVWIVLCIAASRWGSSTTAGRVNVGTPGGGGSTGAATAPASTDEEISAEPGDEATGAAGDTTETAPAAETDSAPAGGAAEAPAGGSEEASSTPSGGETDSAPSETAPADAAPADAAPTGDSQP